MRGIRKVAIAVIVAGFCTGVVHASGPDSARLELRVATYDFYPLCRAVRENSLDGGLFTTLLEDVATKEGWTLEYVPGTMAEGLHRLEEQEVDLAIAASYTREAAERFTFTRETVISTWATVYAPEKANVQSLLDLAGKAVGVVRDDPYNQKLRSTMRRFDVACTFVEFIDYDKVFAGIAEGWVDVGVVDRLYGALHEGEHSVHRTPIIFSPVDLRFAVHGDGHADVIAVLDYHLDALKRDTRSVYYQELERMLGAVEEMQVPRALVYGLGIMAGLLLFVGAGALLLRRQVTLKTAEISHKNRELEREVARRSAAERAVRQSSELMSNIFSSMRDGLLVVQSEGLEIVKCNVAVAELFRYSPEELVGLSARELHPDDRAANRFERIVPSSIGVKGYMRGEFRMRRKDGSLFPVELVVTPVKAGEVAHPSWVIIVRDNTLAEELARNERRLRQAQKMEAIGTLAGGIAHDFNNILMPIIGYVELLERLVPKEQQIQHHYLSQVAQATDRARSLVGQILAFSRQREQDSGPLQVSLIVKEALKLLRASLPSTIDIRQDILTRRDTVRADPTQIHQVVMNLCTNAAHAMRQEGGELRVVLRDHTGGVSGFGDTDIDLTDDCLEIRVSDTGQGIEPWVQERIFDPFFTTKRQGEGTGMGLSVVHGIVKACCGAITCESTVGQGTTFHVYLPRIDESVEGEKQPDDTDSQVPAGDGERILFVDDEKMIADLAEVALGELGYEVVTTTSSINALALFKEDPDTFDVVITDQTMPGLTGGDLVRRILDFRPDTPVILCTGYSETMTREKARALGVREYLMKPVDYNHLARQLREILAPAAAAQTPPTRRKPPTTTTPVVE